MVQYQAVIQLAQMAPDIYDLPKLHFQWIEQEVKEYAGYEPPSRQRVGRAINAHFNKTF